ncbi:hypothetical protein GCM10027200_49300 [Lentzea nigeriaca]
MLGITGTAPDPEPARLDPATSETEEPVTPMLPAPAAVPSGERPSGLDRPRFSEPPKEEESGPLVGLRQSWVEDVPENLRIAWQDQEVVPLETTTADRLRRKPPFEPLLRRASTSALVQAMLSRRLPGDEVDVPTLVDELAAGRAVTSLPMSPRPTLRCGAHVLIEESSAMSLFWRDQWELAKVVRNVVGPGLTDVTVFRGSPLRPRRDHPQPAPRRAVLVLSAFDMQRGRANREDWERYVAALRQRDCRVVGLVPFPRERWSAWLTGLMPLVCWDRSTTVGTVRSAMGRAA